jgi:hypothetical protein
MNKNIGFRRNIYLPWLEAAAAFCLEADDAATLRARLDPIVEEQIKSAENRRIAIDILLNIWLKTHEKFPGLRDEALQLFARVAVQERLWLHYGMTLLYYDFFRFVTATIGQLSRYTEAITPKEIKKRVFAELGQLGALEKATERVLFSLRNWGLLDDTEERYAYRAKRNLLTTRDTQLQEWLLSVALTAHPAEEISFDDLLRLPELFPFELTVTVDALRLSPRFNVHRQGLGWDMVRIAPREHPIQPARALRSRPTS